VSGKAGEFAGTTAVREMQIIHIVRNISNANNTLVFLKINNKTITS